MTSLLPLSKHQSQSYTIHHPFLQVEQHTHTHNNCLQSPTHPHSWLWQEMRPKPNAAENAICDNLIPFQQQPVPRVLDCTAWCSEIGSQTSLNFDACNWGAPGYDWESLSLHQAVITHLLFYFCIVLSVHISDNENIQNLLLHQAFLLLNSSCVCTHYPMIILDLGSHGCQMFASKIWRLFLQMFPLPSKQFVPNPFLHDTTIGGRVNMCEAWNY